MEQKVIIKLNKLINNTGCNIHLNVVKNKENLALLHRDSNNIINSFSNSYDKIKESFIIPANIDNQILEFIDKIQKDKPDFDVIVAQTYFDFFNNFSFDLKELLSSINESIL